MESDGASSSSLTILEKLKVDCMLMVFSYLPASDLVRSQRVSKAWSDLVLYKLSSIRSFKMLNSSLRYNNIFTMSSLRHLLMKIGPGLHCLELNYFRIQFDNRIPLLIAELCPNLQKLLIFGVDINSWDLLLLRCKHLKSISFSYCSQVTDDVVSSFAHKLEELRIINCNVTGSFLLNYRSSRIRKLELSDCKILEPSLLCETVGEMKHLTSLTLDTPSDEMIAWLHNVLLQLPQLQEFSCCTIFQEEGSLAPLAAMKDLRVLCLKANCLLNDQVFKDICTNCTHLRVLNIVCTSVKRCFYVWMLPELEELRMDYLKLPRSSAVAENSILKVLTCFNLESGPNSVQRLIKLCPNLSVLVICNLDIPKVTFIQEIIEAVKQQPNRIHTLKVRLMKNYRITEAVNNILRSSDCRLVTVMWREMFRMY